LPSFPASLSGQRRIRAVLGEELPLLARTELLPGNRDQAGRAAGDRFHFSGGAARADDELLAVVDVGQRRQPSFRQGASLDIW